MSCAVELAIFGVLESEVTTTIVVVCVSVPYTTDVMKYDEMLQIH